jgi:hypothetical protein
VEKIEVTQLMAAGRLQIRRRDASRNELTDGVGSTTTEQQFACTMNVINNLTKRLIE